MKDYKSLIRKEEFFTELETPSELKALTETLLEDDVWIICNAEDLHVLPIGAMDDLKNADGIYDVKSIGPYGDISYSDYITHWRLNVSESDLADALKSKMMMRLHGEWHLVSIHAIDSISAYALDQAKINEKLSTSELCSKWNFSWKYRGGEICKALIRGGKLMTLRTKEYTPITQHDFFDLAEEELSKLFAIEFRVGISDHKLTEVRYDIIGNSKDELIASYSKALSKAGLSEVFTDATPYILVSTGDTGEAAVQVSPYLRVEPIGAIPLSPSRKNTMVRHRGKNNLESLKPKIEKVYSKMREGIEKIEDLLSIPIHYPAAVIVSLGKEYRMSKAKVNEEAELLIMQKEDGIEHTAFDIYCIAHQILSSKKNSSTKTVLERTEALAQILMLDWTKQDRNGPVSW